MSSGAGVAFALGIPGGAWVAGLVFVLLAALFAQSARESRFLPARRRAGLLALRGLGLLLGFLVVVQPSWLEERTERTPGRLVVLVDTSRSMTVGRDGATRAGLVREVLARWAREPAFARATLLAFDSGVRPTTREALASDEGFAGESTRLAEALRELSTDDRGHEVGAFVVVADGASSGHTDPLDVAALGGARVHTLAVPDASPLRDRSIVRIRSDARAFLRQPYLVRVDVRAEHLAGRSLPVSLYRGDEILAVREVVLDERGIGEVRFEVSPQRVGTVFHRVSLEEDASDAVPENDARSFLVHVGRDRLRVLHVAGQPSWDVRFLRAFLKRDPSIDLISFFILRTTTDLTMADPSEMALIPFPTDELFREHLASFDVVVFQDFNYRPFGMAQYLPGIARYVENGGSFAMIGGDVSFASGDYVGTAIERVLPVTMPASAAGAVVAEAFSPSLVPFAERHPLVALSPDPIENRRLFAAMPELLGANLLEGVAEGAVPLLVHPRMRVANGQPMPVLAVGERGQGRVLAFAADSSYRWGITAGGRSGDASVFERFWDRTLRWLARDPALEASRVLPSRERVGPRAQLAVEVLARDATYAPILSHPLRLEVRDAADAVVGSVEVRVDEEGRGEVRVGGPVRPGAYRLVLVDGTAATALAESAVVVETGGDELADPRADAGSLARIAAATRGRHVEDARSAPSLASFDSTRERSLGIVPHAPFRSPIALLALVALLVGEWWARRRLGLA